jgi:hypothetical protein
LTTDNSISDTISGATTFIRMAINIRMYKL